MPIFKNFNRDFFKSWSPDVAYVLGFFAADGYITINKRGGHFFCFNITDKLLLEKMRTALGSNHILGIKKGYATKHKTQHRLQIGSKEACKDLFGLGFTVNKTHTMVIPKINKKCFGDFVRGYFDGDGNIWKGFVHKDRQNPHLVLKLSFTSCSFSFIHQLQKKLLGSKIGPGSLYRKDNFCRLSYSTIDALKLHKFMYANCKNSLYLERKKVIFSEFLREKCGRSSAG